MQLYHIVSMLHKGNDCYNMKILLLIRFSKIDKTRAVSRKREREKERDGERDRETEHAVILHLINVA